MAATSAPAVKAALLQLFRSTAENVESALHGATIEYTHPGVTMPQELVWFNKTISKEAAAAMGRRRRDEDYTIELCVDVSRDGNNGQAAEERAWAIVEVLEELVRENPGRAGDVMEKIVSGWVVWSGAEMTPLIESGQRVAEVVCRITVKNRK